MRKLDWCLDRPPITFTLFAMFLNSFFHFGIIRLCSGDESVRSLQSLARPKSVPAFARTSAPEDEVNRSHQIKPSSSRRAAARFAERFSSHDMLDQRAISCSVRPQPMQTSSSSDSLQILRHGDCVSSKLILGMKPTLTVTGPAGKGTRTFRGARR